MAQDIHNCPHCDVPLTSWMPPEDSSWDRIAQYVCFNDECPYYVRGWQWMMERYSRRASYRHRVDPQTGKAGPLPVVSPNTHRDGIVADPEEPQ